MKKSITICIVIGLVCAGAICGKTVMENPENKLMEIKNDDIGSDVYVRIKDGQLWANGGRLKLWGSQGNLGREPKVIDEEAERFRSLGFNLFRPINVTNPILLSDYDYTPGDGSVMDWQDYTFAAVANTGGYLWLDMLNGFRITVDAVNLVDDPYISETDWLQSISELKNSAKLKTTGGIFYWDLRAKEAYMKYVDKMMTHRNPYRGLTYAQDPSIAIIELMNEQWWLPRALGGAVFADMPAPLMQSLLRRWNDWLGQKYVDSDVLNKAWGDMLPNESLEKKTILLQPLKGRAAADAMSDVLGISSDFDENVIIDVPFSDKRGQDVVKFLMEIHADFCKQAIARIRSHGAPDRGASVVPIVIDTGASFAMPSQYEHLCGSALACATYVHQIDGDVNKPTYPWSAALRKPPTFNSWVDHNRIENHPTLIYELMFFHPGKYRADFALRLLGLATIQDFDVINWHYYNPYSTVKNEALRIPTTDHYWNGVVYNNDEVALATMLLSSTIFRHADLEAPLNPTTLVIGEDFLFDMENLHWGKFSPFLSHTVFQYGLRLRFDENRKESEFIGPYSDGKDVPDVVSPTPNISYYWKDGYMVIESERVRLVAGFLPENFSFSNGESLTGITVNNPDNAPYILDDERYVCFAMCSRDGKPLEESKDIIAIAVSTSWNTGFEFDVDKWQQLQKTQEHPPLNVAKSAKRGTLPILVSRVGWTFNAEWLKGMNAIHYNFEFEAYNQQQIDGNKYSISDTEKLFFVEFKAE